MKKGYIKSTAISFDIRKILTAVKSNSNTVLLFAVFISGMISGTVLIKNSEYFRYFAGIFITETSEIKRGIINGLFCVLLILTINFIMGLCLVGSPFIYFLSFFEGIYISAIYSFRLYRQGFDDFARFYLTDIAYLIIIYVIFVCSQLSALNLTATLKDYYCNHKINFGLKAYLMRYSLYYAAAIILTIVRVFIKTIN